MVLLLTFAGVVRNGKSDERDRLFRNAYEVHTVFELELDLSAYDLRWHLAFLKRIED